MKNRILACTLTLALATLARAGDQPAENPAATQFRQHLAAADQDKDGFVTRAELTAEISKTTRRDPATVEQTVANMLRDLDADHDGKLSAAEINEGARQAGENANTKQNVNRAQQVMAALDGYAEKHAGNHPDQLDDLAKLHLVPPSALHCLLADGHEEPWGYVGAQPVDQKAVVLFSPGRVDSAGQYVVGLANGQVLGLRGDDLALEKIPALKMDIHRDKPEKPAE